MFLMGRSKVSASLRASFFASLFGLSACGGRTEPFDHPAILPSTLPDGRVPCAGPEDCDQSDLCTPQVCFEGLCAWGEEIRCVPPSPCEESACNPATGACEHTSLVVDLDGDGYAGPLPGTMAGDDGSCGDDCDDTNPFSHPGQAEVCDGADNDCDGVIDNGSSYLGEAEQIPTAIELAPDLDGSGRRGIAYGEGVFAVSYWGRTSSKFPYLQGLLDSGESAFSAEKMSNVNAAPFGADLAWSGDSFGALWWDSRSGNYEVYFSRYDSFGNKLAPDLALTDAPGFSINARLSFDQGRFVAVWDDRRNEPITGGAQVYGQFVSPKGELIGENIVLSDALEWAEKPFLAASTDRFGLAYQVLDDAQDGLRFRSFDKFFGDGSEPIVLSEAAVNGPRVTTLGQSFFVTWNVNDGKSHGPSIFGALVDPRGEILVPPGPITFGDSAGYARSHDTISLGNRVILVWSDYEAGNFELYAKVLGPDLEEFEPRLRLTSDSSQSLNPALALGDLGRLGVFFDDWRSGTRGAYFMSIGCGEVLDLR